MTVLQVVQVFAENLAGAGLDDDLTVLLPPDMFLAACDEAAHLMRYPSRLPPETSLREFGEPPSPAALKFAGPAGYVTIRPDVNPQ